MNKNIETLQALQARKKSIEEKQIEIIIDRHGHKKLVSAKQIYFCQYKEILRKIEELKTM